jgi:uncharacterized protein YjbI with pentapeptide repeats
MTEIDRDQAEVVRAGPSAERGAEEAEVERVPRKPMAAAEALEKLRRGQTVQNVRIERLCFRGDFPQPVRLRNCTLVRPRFDGATFAAEVNLAGCTLERPICAGKNVFAGDLLLKGSTLAGVRLTGVTVQGAFACDDIHTRGRFDVFGSHFVGPVRFWSARFDGWANFKGCDFAGEADFRNVHAEHGFVLRNCTFHGPALFRGTSVTLKFELTGSRFEGLLDLSKAKLHDYVYLEEIVQGPNQQFAFANTVGEHVLVQPRQLVGRLASEEKGNHAQAMHEYAFLKRSYEALHRYEDEDWAFYRFKVNQRRSVPRSWARPWTRLLQACDWLLLDQGCGYCANPWRAVRTALIVMLGFGLLYMAGIEQFYVDPAKRPFPDQELGSTSNRVLIGLLTSVSVFTTGVGGIREMAQGWMNVPLMIESLLGTLLWGLFIVAFSRKVIR